MRSLGIIGAGGSLTRINIFGNRTSAYIPMEHIPGGFPERRPPTQAAFTFSSVCTPFMKKQPLYPSLDHMPANLEQQCSQLGYSKKLSNNVLQELDQRAATKLPRRGGFVKSVLSPRSSRFNSSHRQKFSRMESISSHYAASRTREEIELEKENVPSYGPNSKRSGASSLENVAKRRRTAAGKQEVMPSQMTSSKRVQNLQEVLQRPAMHREIKEPIARVPSNTQSTVRQSTSSMNLKKTPMPSSRSVHNNISQLTKPKQLPRSTTLNNITRPTAASVQKSTSNRNLHQQTFQSMRSAPSTNNLSSMPASTMGFGQRPTWR